MDSLRFSIPEILSLFGAAQCVYILVYMMFRSGRISRGGLPLLYFLVLGLAFLSDFSFSYLSDLTDHYTEIQWALWFYGPPLSVLLIIQIAQINKLPSVRHYWVLFLIPCSYLAAHYWGRESSNEIDWLVVLGVVSGGVSLLTVWFHRSIFGGITSQKTGKERYWLVLALVIMNSLFLAVVLAGLSSQVSYEDIILMRTIVGIGIVYLANTSLFRIYPQAVFIASRTPDVLSPEEHLVAQKIENLLSLDKVYQEPAYSRADLARECGVSEALVSRIINLHFQKSFPQLMNEHRIEDAKLLLKQTDAPVKTVSEEVGFNALASFNRVFKDVTGDSPSSFRKKLKVA